MHIPAGNYQKCSYHKCELKTTSAGDPTYLPCGLRLIAHLKHQLFKQHVAPEVLAQAAAIATMLLLRWRWWDSSRLVLLSLDDDVVAQKGRTWPHRPRLQVEEALEFIFIQSWFQALVELMQNVSARANIPDPKLPACSPPYPEALRQCASSLLPGGSPSVPAAS